MLEETKKEVREIRSVEAQMKWNMAREEQKNKIADEQEAEEEIRDWRWRESDEMKEYVETKKQDDRLVQLEESRDFQEFKREVKEVVKQEELQYISEVYETDVENAAWRAEFARAAAEQDKEVIIDRVENIRHIQEVKAQQKYQHQREEDDARVQEQNAEMANLARQLAREKEQLLESLELTRNAQRAPVRSGPGSRLFGR